MTMSTFSTATVPSGNCLVTPRNSIISCLYSGLGAIAPMQVPSQTPFAPGGNAVPARTHRIECAAGESGRRVGGAHDAEVLGEVVVHEPARLGEVAFVTG